MKRKYLITKCAIVAAVLTVTLGISGCGTKSVDYSLNDEEEGSSGMRGILSVPKECDLTFAVGGSGLTSISLKDDDIQVPQVDAMKRYSFDKYEYTPERVQKLVEGVMDKDKGIYYRKSYDVMTKSEIKEQMNALDKQLNSEAGDSEDTSWYDSQMKDYRNLLNTAPDSLPAVTDYDEPYWDYEGVCGDSKCKMVLNTGIETTSIGVYLSFTKDDKNKEDKLSQVDGATDVYYTSPDEFQDLDVEELTNKCGKTQAEATSEAMNFLDAIGIEDMYGYKVEPCICVWISDSDILQTEADGYVVTMRRNLDKCSIFSGIAMFADNVNLDGSMIDDKEELTLYINDEGVFNMSGSIWADGATEKVKELQLLSWDDMLEKAGDSICDYYKKYPTSYSSVEFNEVWLSYIVCADEEGGLYYQPTWIFAQYDDVEHEADENIRQIVYINAEDGSVIDMVENAQSVGTYIPN